MKLANKIIREALNKKELEGVRDDVIISFGDDDMKKYKTFDKFYDEVDAMMGYEEDWDASYWKPYYKAIWDEYQKGKIKLKG